MTARKNSLEHALEEAVSRALRDNLAPLQRTADELQQAYADLVAACSSSRPSNALPALLRAQTSAAALAAGLSVLSNFVAVALNPRDEAGSGARAGAVAAATAQVEEEEEVSSATRTEVRDEEVVAAQRVAEAEPESESEWAEEPAEMPAGTMVPEDVPLEEPAGDVYNHRDPAGTGSRAARGCGVRRCKPIVGHERAASPRESCSQSFHARHQIIAPERG